MIQSTNNLPVPRYTDPAFECRIAEIAERLEQTHSPYYAQQWLRAVRYLHKRWVLYRMVPRRNGATW